VAIIAGIGWNARVIYSPPIFVVHIVLAALFAFIALGFLAVGAAGDEVDGRSEELMIVVLLLGFMLWGAGGGRFGDAYGVLAIIVVTFYCFRLLFANWYVSASLVIGAVCLGVVVSTYRAFGFSETLMKLATVTVASRLGLDALGGFNAYAFLLSVALVGLFYFFRVARSKLVRLGCILGGLYLFAYLVATLSRGGMVGLVVGVTVFTVLSVRRPHRAIWLLSAGAALVLIALVLLLPDLTELKSRYDLFDDRSGTGRTFIWGYLLARLADAPLSIVFGNGTGSIDFQTPWTHIESAHSTYLEIVFTYGVIGLAIVTFFLWRSMRRIARQPRSLERAMMLAISSQMLAAGFFDSYHGSAQVGWFYGVWFALIWSLDDRRELAAERATPPVSGPLGEPAHA
jgi:O-antigen ligase